MPALIVNRSNATLTLPFPLGSVLAPGLGAAVNLTTAQVLAILGTSFGTFVEVREISTTSFDALAGGVAAGGTMPSGLSLAGALQAPSAVFSGDIAAGGGFRQQVGPFTAPGAAGVVAASQTNLDCRYSHTVTAIASNWVAQRPGSIVGISFKISAAVTTAGGNQTLVCSAHVNGTEVALTAGVDSTGALTKASATAAKDTLPFVAGDEVGISYTTTAISNTPALWGTLEIEQ